MEKGVAQKNQKKSTAEIERAYREGKKQAADAEMDKEKEHERKWLFCAPISGLSESEKVKRQTLS